MKRQAMKKAIKETLCKKEYLELVKSDAFHISDRIKRIDPDYFIVVNHRTGKYEVHNSSNVGNTYCFSVPYLELDDRTLEYCKETLVENDIDLSIEAFNRKIKKSKEREESNLFESTSREFADRMNYAVEEDQLHKGYRKSHYISSAK